MLVANWLFGPFLSPFFGRKIMLLNRPPVHPVDVAVGFGAFRGPYFRGIGLS